MTQDSYEICSTRKVCIKCKKEFEYSQADTWWDENGSSSTKLVSCPKCNCAQPIQFGYIHDVNNDERYYE